MVVRRDERITRFALASANRGGRLKTGEEAPQYIETIRVDAIDPDPDQPRRHFDPDRLQELADSLLSVGQLQPIIVVRADERFRLHVGERRWRASALAGLATVRAVVRATPLEAQASLIAQIVENEQRAELTTTELIDAVRRLQADGLKNVEIAQALARAPTRISELSALAEAPDALRRLADVIGLGLAYQLLRQWRAQPDAALEFIANMPVEHISRVTIATIGADASGNVEPPLLRHTPSAASSEIKRAGEGAPPRNPVTPPHAPSPTSQGMRERALRVDPTSPPATGALLVDHSDHGAGRVVFGIDVPVDHLAIRFSAPAIVIAHKDEIRIVRSLAPGQLEH